MKLDSLDVYRTPERTDRERQVSVPDASTGVLISARDEIHKRRLALDTASLMDEPGWEPDNILPESEASSEAVKLVETHVHEPQRETGLSNILEILLPSLKARADRNGNRLDTDRLTEAVQADANPRAESEARNELRQLAAKFESN